MWGRSPAWRAENAEKVRGYWRASYYRNRQRLAAERRRRKADVRQWLREYKQGLTCATCGERHPATLDFHHTEAADKEFSIGDAANYKWSRSRLLDEIAKCEILCANCHRKRHWTERTVRRREPESAMNGIDHGPAEGIG
ncbi:MAG: hypothetical protein JOY61_15405 [Chloroflexi bacterium]|nr:hypothetical protein [Chloroflexota bacterium]